MTLPNLLTDNDPYLRLPTIPVDLPLRYGFELRAIAEMQEIRQRYKAVGLAANQIGYNYRMFVMGNGLVDYVCINPEIISVSDKVLPVREGCLSFNGLILPVKRPIEIEVRYVDIHERTVSAHFDGLFARCFQHELDHLNGIVFTDHVSKLTLKMQQKKRQKRIYG